MVINLHGRDQLSFTFNLCMSMKEFCIAIIKKIPIQSSFLFPKHFFQVEGCEEYMSILLSLVLMKTNAYQRRKGLESRVKNA